MKLGKVTEHKSWPKSLTLLAQACYMFSLSAVHSVLASSSGGDKKHTHQPMLIELIYPQSMSPIKKDIIHIQ